MFVPVIGPATSQHLPVAPDTLLVSARPRLCAKLPPNHSAISLMPPFAHLDPVCEQGNRQYYLHSFTSSLLLLLPCFVRYDIRIVSTTTSSESISSFNLQLFLSFPSRSRLAHQATNFLTSPRVWLDSVGPRKPQKQSHAALLQRVQSRPAGDCVNKPAPAIRDLTPTNHREESPICEGGARLGFSPGETNTYFANLAVSPRSAQSATFPSSAGFFLIARPAMAPVIEQRQRARRDASDPADASAAMLDRRASLDAAPVALPRSSDAESLPLAASSPTLVDRTVAALPLVARQDAPPTQTTTTIIPASYPALSGGPDAGAVVGIVLGSVAGFLLFFWLLWTCVNFGNPPGDVESSFGGTGSLYSRRSRRHHHHHHHHRKRSGSRRETVEVRTARPIIVEAPLGGERAERIRVVEEATIRRGSSRGPHPVRVVSEEEDEIVVEENGGGSHRRDRSARRGGSTYRERDEIRRSSGGSRRQ